MTEVEDLEDYARLGAAVEHTLELRCQGLGAVARPNSHGGAATVEVDANHTRWLLGHDVEGRRPALIVDQAQAVHDIRRAQRIDRLLSARVAPDLRQRREDTHRKVAGRPWCGKRLRPYALDGTANRQRSRCNAYCGSERDDFHGQHRADHDRHVGQCLPQTTSRPGHLGRQPPPTASPRRPDRRRGEQPYECHDRGEPQQPPLLAAQFQSIYLTSEP
ncbi:MAG: hypothetical protein FJX11_04065 [Alphaproteobacteria bacterium]|nr:hypothetical protein [Alphaproteobacteria bacterium]